MRACSLSCSLWISLPLSLCSSFYHPQFLTIAVSTKFHVDGLKKEKEACREKAQIIQFAKFFSLSPFLFTTPPPSPSFSLFLCLSLSFSLSHRLSLSLSCSLSPCLPVYLLLSPSPSLALVSPLCLSVSLPLSLLPAPSLSLFLSLFQIVRITTSVALSLLLSLPRMHSPTHAYNDTRSMENSSSQDRNGSLNQMSAEFVDGGRGGVRGTNWWGGFDPHESVMSHICLSHV